MPRRFRSLALLALSLAGPAAAEWREIPYADMAKMPLGLKTADPQGVYTAWYVAKPAEGKTALPPGLQLQVKAGDQLFPVAIAPDGRLDLPFRKDWADQGAVVRVNQPKGSFRISFNMQPRVPAGTRMSYGQLTESATVMERGIKQMAGMLSLFAPKVKAFTLEFAAGATHSATLTWPDGKKKTWKSDGDGQVHLPWEPGWSKVMVELSAPLKDLGPKLK
jgi:hypothetical protein